ncbi:MAG: hypothetical protein KA354_04030 [Phycisphaerae bacterium]|nr:hypothetical protein [Phycisphaerae bacterium]
MVTRRTVAAWTTFLTVTAVLGGTLAYAAYYRSDRYRRSVETDLTDFFGMPFEVGGIQAHSFTARRLMNVHVWLPERRARIFSAPLILWDKRDPEAQGGAGIHVHDAAWSIGSEDWRSEDYMQVLRASLAHDFNQLNLRQVRFHSARIDWPRRDFHLAAEGVNGRVTFATDGKGLAELSCTSLNGQPVSDPIRIRARIDPEAEEFLPEVTLHVPHVPLTGLGLAGLVASPVTQGSFSGRMTVRKASAGDEVQLVGAVDDVRLEEFTPRLPGGAVPAVVTLDIRDALIRDRQLLRLEFTGQIRKLGIEQLLSRWSIPPIGGEGGLNVYRGLITDAGIEDLRLDGQWDGASLDKLVTATLGRGGLNGTLNVRINSLIIAKNEIVTADVDVTARPPTNGKGTLSKVFLTFLMEKFLNKAIPQAALALLPEEVEYSRMGAKVLVDRRRVRILGTQAATGQSLLTIPLAGHDLPALPLDVSLELGPLTENVWPNLKVLAERAKERIKHPNTQKGGIK